MTNENFKEKNLPLQEMEQLGLAKNGKLNISSEDLNALLKGNRTDFVRLENINSDGVKIDSLDAKLSLRSDDKGKLTLLLHPIYKSAQAPEMLSKQEVEDLKEGKVNNIPKEVGTGNEKKSIFVEYDKDTNEFLKVDSAKVVSPETVNDQTLTPNQKKKFKEGEEIELRDGTTLQATSKNKTGVISNKAFLIMSILLDGGLSYVIINAAKALKERKEKVEYTKGYNDALNKVLKEQKNLNIPLNPKEKSYVILKDFKELTPTIPTKDSNINLQKVNPDDVKLEPKHLTALKEVVSYDNLKELTNKVDPKLNREVAQELTKEWIITPRPKEELSKVPVLELQPEKQPHIELKDRAASLTEYETKEALMTVPYISGSYGKSTPPLEIMDFFEQARDKNPEKKEIYAQAVKAIDNAVNEKQGLSTVQTTNNSIEGQLKPDPLQVENNKTQAKQLEHFATLAEVVSMIETKRDHVIDYIKDSGQPINDQDYLKDVVSEISSSLSPAVKNVANQFVNENQEVLDVTLDDTKEEKQGVVNSNEAVAENEYEQQTGRKR